MCLWAVVCLVGLILDPRTLADDPIWAKPLKFSISLALYAITLAWMLSMVQRPVLRRIGWWAGTVGAAASLLEIVVISIQVVRGVGSHFNVSTPTNQLFYQLMAGGVTLMYCATLVIGAFLAMFSRIEDRALAWSLRLGLIIALVGLSVGFLMVIPTAAQLADPTSSTYGSHSVGGDDATGGIFFLGWNTAHGDLRVSHFIGMHALQVLPILAITLPRALSEADRLRIVVAAGATYAAVTAILLWQALRGQSVIHPDAITVAAGGVTIVLAAMSFMTIAAQRRHQHR
ncbi:hypothetical protein [Curtobacterium flaccumfaciens]|uniref:hypothetical protein n=1 Tax=Curtobacterium flaccumfaciens TaxID=2035 RepID=UPI0024A948F2|nr:hypothetical protein [Curtobacterium flaccumfaciens]